MVATTELAATGAAPSNRQDTMSPRRTDETARAAIADFDMIRSRWNAVAYRNCSDVGEQQSSCVSSTGQGALVDADGAVGDLAIGHATNSRLRGQVLRRLWIYEATRRSAEPFQFHNTRISATSTTTAKRLASGPKRPPVNHSGLSSSSGRNQPVCSNPLTPKP